MTRSQERMARRQAAITRQRLFEFEQAIAEATAAPPAGVDARLHEAYLAGVRSVRDDLRAELAGLECPGVGTRTEGGARV